MSDPKDAAAENYQKGYTIAATHPLVGRLLQHLRLIKKTPLKNYCPPNGWAVAVNNGEIHVHPTRRAAPEEWAYVLAHCALHFGLDHFKLRQKPGEWNAAACSTVARFLDGLKIGRAPLDRIAPGPIPARSEEMLYREFCERGIPGELADLGVAGPGVPDLWFATGHQNLRPWRWRNNETWSTVFAEALQAAVTETIEKAGSSISEKRKDSPAELARRWFINHYPLLGALAAGFEIVEAPEELAGNGVEIGAVQPGLQRIFINTRRLDPQETIFVMAHEMLHAALQHDLRRQGRDAFLWNVACDFVINHWLIEMGIGRMPSAGALLDPDLQGLSAEAIYDRIASDLRRYRKHATFRGSAKGDILGDTEWRSSGEGIRLDEFYRQALQQGLVYHEEQGRGLLPAGLVKEIRALSHPPIPWDVELARWLDNWFQPLERGRTFARPSRRQSSTPDIARPSWVLKYPLDSRTFGVVLDTSGSMWWKVRRKGLVNDDLLGSALGAIASYAMSRDVPAVRVVFCDALAYDQGYMAPEDIAGRVKLKGQGGTVLQPAIQLLEKSDDFPREAPLLIITDGHCDVLKVPREHAFLIPESGALPFPPIGPVFRVAS